MQIDLIDTPAEADVRFQGYRLDVVSHWPPSQRKVAAAAAISQRLATIAHCALVRPDISDLLHLSCRLLDDLFAAEGGSATHHEMWKHEHERSEEAFDQWEVY
jgi:hypothetical protein